MKRYVVHFPRHVQDQIATQVLHIAVDSIDNALAWEARLRLATETIGDGPGLAIDEEMTARLGCTVRKYVFENTYLVRFTTDDAARTVEIVNFRHGARLPSRGEP